MEATNTNITTSGTITIDIFAEIRCANDLVESKFAAGDATGLADLYTEDGMLLPAGLDFIKGRKGIKHYWQNIMNMSVKQARLETLEIEYLNNTAIEMCNYTLRARPGVAIVAGLWTGLLASPSLRVGRQGHDAGADPVGRPAAESPPHPPHLAADQQEC